jgi:hypothetical protein
MFGMNQLSRAVYREKPDSCSLGTVYMNPPDYHPRTYP